MLSEQSPTLRAQIRREFVKGIIYQFVRFALTGLASSLITKGLLTSGQSKVLIFGITTAVVSAGFTVGSAVLRYARMEAAKRGPVDASPKDVRELAWQIIGELLAGSNAPIISKG